MQQTQIIMGMPVSINIPACDNETVFLEVFKYFHYVDSKYSTYKRNSEISRINRGLPKSKWSHEMRRVLALCEVTKYETGGYFDINRNGKLDPSGLVKGWAINNAANILRHRGIKDFYIDAGGDIQADGINEMGNAWSVGIRNPFNRHEIIKILNISNLGVATSGTAIRGDHIYNPKQTGKLNSEVISITVVGPNIFHADRFATAAFAMGARGYEFIASLNGFEAYLVTHDGIATLTKGLAKYEQYVPTH